MAARPLVAAPLTLSLTDDDREALARLTAGVMSPTRPRLAACLRQLSGAPDAVCDAAALRPEPLRAVVSWLCGRDRAWPGHQDPREAWEVLCPAAWAGDTARGFVGADNAWRTTPADLNAALTLAADPEGVLAAEDLARVVATELRGVIPDVGDAGAGFDRVWRVVDARAWRAPYTRAGPGGARGALRHDALHSLLAADLLRDADELARAVRAGAMPRVGGCGWDASVVARWSLAARGTAREGLFAALRALWCTGYALEQVDGGACVLVAPRVA